MERYLEKNEQLASSSERRSSRSWTTFLSGAEQRPSSLPLQLAAAGQSFVVPLPHQQILPVSFTLHRHCSTPSPTASSSPFSLASPSSLGATTPDDDGTNPVDILSSLNIDGVASEPQSGRTVNGDVVSLSSSSTTSWDSARSDPDVPIPVPPTPFIRGALAPVRQRYVRRPTELCLTAGTAHRMPTSSSPCRTAGVHSLPRNASNENAACIRRIAKRRWRTTAFGADDTAASPVTGRTSPSVAQHPVSPPRGTAVPAGIARTRWIPSHAPSHPIPRMPPLPSAAEMAYLRSLSGGMSSRTIDPEAAKGGSTDSTGARGVQRAATTADRSCPPPASLSPSTSVPETSRVAGVEASTTTTADSTGTDAKKQARVYGCSVVECGKLYSKSSHLKAHMRSHTGTITVY